MNDRQRRFVDEYLIDLNATQAAIRAGYSKNTARAIAYKLLTKADIRAEIAQRRQKTAEKHEVTRERIVAELAKLGFSNMQDYMTQGPDGDPVMDWSKLSRDQAAALVEVAVDSYMDGKGEDAREVKRVKFKLADKRAALVDLGKHLGLFAEKLDVNLTVTEVPEGVRDRIRAATNVDLWDLPDKSAVH